LIQIYIVSVLIAGQQCCAFQWGDAHSIRISGRHTEDNPPVGNEIEVTIGDDYSKYLEGFRGPEAEEI
jgi:hypothetical protein